MVVQKSRTLVEIDEIYIFFQKILDFHEKEKNDFANCNSKNLILNFAKIEHSVDIFEIHFQNFQENFPSK